MACFEFPDPGLSARGSLKCTFLKGDVLRVKLGRPPPSGARVLEGRGCGSGATDLRARALDTAAVVLGTPGLGLWRGTLAREAAWEERRQAPPGAAGLGGVMPPATASPMVGAGTWEQEGLEPP